MRKWVIDLPAGSAGRLFDLNGGPKGAVDLGLYYVQLHVEILDAVPFVASVLRPVAETDGAAGVLALFRTLKRDSSAAYFFGESQLNAVGSWLLDAGKADDAVMVFRLNTKEYPQAASAYHRLGDAYLALGDTARAVGNYRRAIALDPKNQDVAAVLDRMGIKR